MMSEYYLRSEGFIRPKETLYTAWERRVKYHLRYGLNEKAIKWAERNKVLMRAFVNLYEKDADTYNEGEEWKE